MANTTALFRSKNTTEAIDDAAPVVIGATVAANQSVIITLPDTVGPWIDAKGAEYPQNTTQVAQLPTGGVIQAADPITVAEFALLNVVTGSSAVINQVVGVAQQINVPFGDEAVTNNYPGNSATDYLSDIVPVTLGAGSAQFTLNLWQKCTNLENGTRVGGLFEILNPDDTVLHSIQFQERNFDTTLNFDEDEQVFAIPIPATGSYKLQFTTPGGVGAGNRSSVGGAVNCSIVNAAYDTSGFPAPISGIDHITRTSGDGSPGTTDTYTMWGDVAETVSLGDFDINQPASGSWQVTSVYEPATPIAIANTVISTGFDMTVANSRVTFYFQDDPAGIPWPAATILCSTMTDLTNSGTAFFVWNHSGAYMTAHINGAASKAAGDIRFVDQVRGAAFIRAELEVLT